MGKKQTAVEWLVEQIEEKGESWENVSIGRTQISIKVEDYLNLIAQAKAMEKEQMDKVSEDWFVEGLMHIKDNKRIYQSFEEYYNKIYKK